MSASPYYALLTFQPQTVCPLYTILTVVRMVKLCLLNHVGIHYIVQGSLQSLIDHFQCERMPEKIITFLVINILADASQEQYEKREKEKERIFS